MIYHEIMQKIIKLPGWSWEWKFGDHVWHDVNEFGIITGLNTFLTVHYLNGATIINSLENHIIPLPSIEQWMEIGRNNGKQVFVESYSDGTSWIRFGNDHSGRFVDDALSTLAILFARVVLGYKFDGKEFVKC